METDTNNYKYFKYNEYWQNNLQRIESISKDLEQHFLKLEKEYYNFDAFYDEIITRIDLLASIYSSHNNLKGREYILKLKALLNNYKKKYSHNGVDFKAINFLNSKINKLREASFNNFPEMKHSYYMDIDTLIESGGTVDRDIERYNSLKASAKYKWITYKRNGSWFITQYDKFKLLNPKDAETIVADDSRIRLQFENKFIDIIDIFSEFNGRKKEKINYYIVININNNLSCHAAGKLGRIIMANKNFISPFLKTLIKNKISSGRFRIFGKNHLYLEPISD